MTSGRMWILAAVVSVMLVPAFGSASAPKVFQIVIDKATFSATPPGIKVGDTIEWINNDIFDHTATSKSGGWDVVIPAGKRSRVVMKTAGLFDYLCKYHPNMTGTVRVGKK